MDIFGRFARDPACLVAIDAADGGSWRSPFRPGVVYPSSVPRNFAADPAIYHDFVRAWNSYIITDDVSVKVQFVFKEMPTTQFAVFGVKGSTIHFVAGDGNNGGRVIMGCGFWYTATSTRFVNYVFHPVAGQIYTAEFKKIGNVESVFLDGVQVATRTETISTSVPVPYYVNTPRSETFNGNVLSVELENLTTGKTVWQYPSFEERSRLITKTNVWTSNGVFEAASLSAAWSIKYADAVPAGDYTAVIDTTAAVIARMRKAGVTTTYTDGEIGGTLPYLTMGLSTLSGGSNTKMRHFLLFDRALHQAEIQLLR